MYDDCTVNGRFRVFSWRNNGLVLEIWFSYVCSGRYSWSNTIGIECKVQFDFVEMYAHP